MPILQVKLPSQYGYLNHLRDVNYPFNKTLNHLIMTIGDLKSVLGYNTLDTIGYIDAHLCLGRSIHTDVSSYSEPFVFRTPILTDSGCLLYDDELMSNKIINQKLMDLILRMSSVYDTSLLSYSYLIRQLITDLTSDSVSQMPHYITKPLSDSVSTDVSSTPSPSPIPSKPLKPIKVKPKTKGKRGRPRKQSSITSSDSDTTDVSTSIGHSTASISSEIETPKVKTPKVETLKVATPKVETPKVETPKVETPKVETPNSSNMSAAEDLNPSDDLKPLDDTDDVPLKFQARKEFKFTDTSEISSSNSDKSDNTGQTVKTNPLLDSFL